MLGYTAINGSPQYIYLREGGFVETGANSLNLQVGGINTSALRGILVAYGSRLIRQANGQSLSLEHERSGSTNFSNQIRRSLPPLLARAKVASSPVV